MTLEKSYRLPVPILGVQLRGRRNPFLVLLSSKPVIRVTVEVGEAEEGASRLRVKGEPPPTDAMRLALSSFLDEVSARLEQSVEVELAYSTSFYHPAGVYAVLTYAIVEAVAVEGGYEMSPLEVAQAANSIDADAGVDLDYVDAAREALARGSSLVYRRGEQPIEVKVNGVIELVGEVKLGDVIEDKLDEEIHTALTRLVGISVAVWARRVVEEGWEGLRRIWGVASRVENSLYYMLFGVEPPEESECKWTPGLYSAFLVCVERGLGDRLEVA